MYFDNILKIFKIEDGKKVHLPMKHGIRLCKDHSPNMTKELERMSRVPYLFVIWLIMYDMTCTRHDISYAMSMLIQYHENTGNSRWTTMKNILKYLKRPKDMFLAYGGKEKLWVTCYIDASCQNDMDNWCS